MKNINSEGASISVFVIIAFIFCMTILVNIYWSSTNYQVAVLQAEQRIQEIYGEDVKRMKEIHDSIGETETEEEPSTPQVNTNYWRTGKMTLCTIGGRNYYKYDEGGAICGAGYCLDALDGTIIWGQPVLISTSPDAVRFTTTYDSTISEYKDTIEYDGTLYYICYQNRSMRSTISSSNVEILNDRSSPAANWEELCRLLLDKYFR